ncbi:hypothetical protein EJM90_04545, partial [Listeria monocytogenes]|nr:hypothetical protein [Listeria monocytogenes]
NFLKNGTKYPSQWYISAVNLFHLHIWIGDYQKISGKCDKSPSYLYLFIYLMKGGKTHENNPRIFT